MSRVFGLDEAEIVSAVSELLPRADMPADPASAKELFSVGVWSRLAEPGDGLAGWFTNAVGPVRALELLLSRVETERVMQEITGTGQHSEKTPKRFAESLSFWSARLNSQQSLRDFEFARSRGLTLLIPGSPYWPAGFTDLDAHAPLALWTRGNSNLLLQDSLAVVGSRAATGYGETVTAELVSGVLRRGYVIVSGGAYGIDGVAHRTSLATSQKTVAFLAGGVDYLYPSGHENLLNAVAEHGLLCAELPPGSRPTKWRFLQRNRLIAAATKATLVCEAGHRSGSLNTAGHAAQLGRAIGAVPGPITSAASAGCHRLLRDYDAVCVRNVRDVLELLGEESSSETIKTLPGESGPQRRVLDALSKRSPRSVERISLLSGLFLGEVHELLLELELFQLATRTENGWKLQ